MSAVDLHPSYVTWSENVIITVWMLKWTGKTDREVASEMGRRLREVKWLIKHNETFRNANGGPSWLPDRWYERYSDQIEQGR